jgi:HEPN domain-containing protein
MSPQERLYKPEYAPQLLSIAKGDLQSANVLARSKEGRRENIAFHAQQVIEKAIKAVLCHKKIPIPLLHGIGGVFVAKLPSDNLPPEGYLLNELNEYATVRRYEEGMVEITAEDIKSILNKAKAVLDWADHHLVGAKK